MRVRFLFVLILLLAFFLRFHKVTDFPPGLGRDEVSVAYNAYSILKTGRDEHGRFFPVYFEAIGDQKLPVIIYTTVPSIFLFGLNEFGARFPFALFGTLTILFLYLFLKEAWILKQVQDDTFRPYKLFILAPLLLALNPWQLAHSRAVYEITLGTSFLTLGSYLFLKGLKSIVWMLVCIIVFVITFYTYSMTRILAPLLFIYYLYIFRKQVFRFKKSVFVLFIIWSIFLLPFFITFFDPGGIYGPQGVVILTSAKVKASIMEWRSYVLHSQASFLGPLFFNRIMLTVYEYFKNVLAGLSPEFLFARGSDMAGMGTNGQFFMVEFIGFLVGIGITIKKAYAQNTFYQMILGWMVLPLLCAALTISPPYATRMLFMVPPMIITIATGWVRIYLHIKKSAVKRNLFVFLLVLIYIWHTTFYLFSYYFRLPAMYAKNWESQTDDLFMYLAKQEKDVEKIVIEHPEFSMYAFYLFWNKIPPETVWKTLVRHGVDSDGWKHGKKFGKYEFRGIDWTNDFLDKKKKILVSFGGAYPDHQLVTKELFYPTKYTVYPYGLKVIALEEKPVAYRIWKFYYEDNKYVLMKE